MVEIKLCGEYTCVLGCDTEGGCVGSVHMTETEIRNIERHFYSPVSDDKITSSPHL